MNLLRRILLVLCVLRAIGTNAQRAQYIGREQGLPTMTVYSVNEDQRGFIWLTSDRGVCRYNGLELEVFTVEDGLPDNEIFSFFEDSKGRIWFGSFNGQLCYFQDEKFHTAANSALPVLENSSFIKTIAEDSLGNLYFQTFQDGLFILNTEGAHFHFLPRIQINQMFPEGEKMVMAASDGKISYLLEITFKNDQIDIDTLFQTTQYSIHTNTGIKSHNSWRFFANMNGNFRKQISIKKNQSQLIKMPFDADQVYFQQEDADLLYIGTVDGLYILDKNTFAIIDKKLDGKQVSMRLKSTNGITYYSTLQHGLFYFPEKNITEQILSETIRTVTLSRDSTVLWFGARDKIFRHTPHNGNTESIPLPDSYGKNNVVYHINELGKDTLLLGSGKFSLLYLNGKFLPRTRQSGVRDMVRVQDTFYLAKGTGLFYEMKSEWLHDDLSAQIHNPLIANEWCKTIEYFQSSLYIGTNSGLFQYKNHVGRRIFPSIKSRITSIASMGEVLAIGTVSEGLYIIKDNKILTQVLPALPSVNELIFIEPNHLMVANDQGVFDLFIEEDGTHSLLLRYPLSSCNALVLGANNKIYMAGLTGAYLQSAQQRFSSEKPALFIRSISINGSESSASALNELSHQENQLQVSLIPVSFIPDGRLKYEYRINGGAWMSFQGPEMNLGPLSAGSYTLEFRCDNYLQTSDSVLVELSIIPAWFNRTSVQLSVLLLSLALLFLIFNEFVKRNKRRAAQVLEISELRQKAFRAQINPHFLFNVLNSIQHFFLKDRAYDGQEYLGKFAKLMRSILNHSDELFVSLHEELERLELYLELEQIRTDKRFDFEINVEQVINPYSISFPSMILQPFLENAIWHGLKGDKNLIQLNFIRVNQNMIILVKDTGPGFDIDEIERSSSKGIKLIKDRIAAMNAMYETQIVLNFRNENGTTVELIIPLNILQ